jgi:hypothetical protein
MQIDEQLQTYQLHESIPFAVECQNATQSSSRLNPNLVVTLEESHHARMARYQFLDSEAVAAFLYYL